MVFQDCKYKPYANKEILPGELSLVDVMKYGISLCPPTTRISRAVRDIPTSYIKGGNNIPNLRQVAEKELEQEGVDINCIRYRECGRHPEYKIKDAIYTTRSYDTQLGKEYFISLESVDERVIFGFIRLRVPYVDNTKFTCLHNKAIIRELHVYGDLVPVGSKSENDVQHKGIGKKLVKLAEKIAYAENKKGVAIISGIGVRGYYEKLNYYLEDTYMVKYFKEEETMLQITYLTTTLIGLLAYTYYTVPSNLLMNTFTI